MVQQLSRKRTVTVDEFRPIPRQFGHSVVASCRRNSVTIHSRTAMQTKPDDFINQRQPLIVVADGAGVVQAVVAQAQLDQRAKLYQNLFLDLSVFCGKRKSVGRAHAKGTRAEL
jgi:hypothetical protein